MTTSPAIFYTRSARATDDNCKRARYWLTESPSSKGKTGLVPQTNSLALDEGILFHDVMTSVLLAPTRLEFELAVSDAMDHMRNEIGWPSEQARLEQMTMVEGLMRGVYRLVRPRILDEYEVLRVEQEIPFEHDGVIQGQKPDAVLRRRADGALIQLDWKSSGLMSQAYFDSWETAVQFQWGPVAITKHMGEPCEAVMIQILYKGKMQDGSLTSAFVYGYAPARRPEGSQLSYAYVKGLRKYPVWAEPGGIKAWVENMPDDILARQLPETRPISARTALVDASLRQAAIREKEIAAASAALSRLERDVDQYPAELWLEARQRLMDAAFPQHFSHCNPVMGYKCEYKDLCFNPVAARSPEAHGFVPRTPHHESEAKFSANFA